MRCPRCKNRVVKKSGVQVEIRIKGKLIITEDGGSTARCFWCGEPVAVPVQLQKHVAASMGAIASGGPDR
jgi:hypothetical protein